MSDSDELLYLDSLFFVERIVESVISVSPGVSSCDEICISASLLQDRHPVQSVLRRIEIDGSRVILGNILLQELFLLDRQWILRCLVRLERLVKPHDDHIGEDGSLKAGGIFRGHSFQLVFLLGSDEGSRDSH